MVKTLLFGIIMCAGFLFQWAWGRLAHFWVMLVVITIIIWRFLPTENSWQAALFFLAGGGLHLLHGMLTHRSRSSAHSRRSGTLA